MLAVAGDTGCTGAVGDTGPGGRKEVLQSKIDDQYPTGDYITSTIDYPGTLGPRGAHNSEFAQNSEFSNLLY